MRGLIPKSRKSISDDKWQTVEKYTATLRNDWGLGLDDTGVGYRKRLRHLRDFVRELELDGVGAPATPSDFDRYERTFAAADRSIQERESAIQQLEDLRVALEPLVKTDCTDPQKYLRSLYGFFRAKTVFHKNVERVLAVLGLKAAPPEESLLGRLNALDGLLIDLEKIDPKRSETARRQWRECVEDCAGDWEWAYLQVLVRLAGECRKERQVSAEFCVQVKRAEQSLATAIPKMERRGYLQYRTQGLYSDLAATHLARAKDSATQPEEQLKLIQRAFTYSRHAVELEPESIRERLVLLDVLSTLGDAGELSVQAEIAHNFDSGPETLRTIGASYWNRVMTLIGRGARLRLLSEAANFFESALQEVESSPFDGDGPLDQVQAHGWAHFWLGRFQYERGKHAEAIAHLRTASALGFKPLESRVELAWACYLVRDRQHANEAYREALAEAYRQNARLAPNNPNTLVSLVSEAPGEERKIVELAFDAYLGWALLCADWDPARALTYITKAKSLLGSINRPNPEELQAALSEVNGRVHVSQGDLATGISELEDSIKKGSRTSAYCALGFARLKQVEQAKTGSPEAQEGLRSAREAYRLARESDSRGRHRSELWELRHRLKSLEPAAPAPQAAAGAGSVKPPATGQPSSELNSEKP